MEKVDTNADGDRRISDIKNGPNAKINKIDDRAHAQAVDPIPDRSAQDKAQCPALGPARPLHAIRQNEKNDEADRDEGKKNGSLSV